MLMLDRDRLIVQSLGRFGQLSPGHLRSMHFAGLASQTPLDRALKRLLERQYIARIERQMVGGTGAGSGQYVYQLGSRGWALGGREGKYWKYRAVKYHTLAIADAYVELLEREREGRIEITAFSTEPESWVTVGGVPLKPDLFAKVADIHNQRTISLWLEVDMGTERQKQIAEKLAAYWHAFQNADDVAMPVFPLVIFLAPDDARARELRWLIEKGPKPAQKLFLVSTVPEYTRLLFS